jgi:predicted GH43/DUF377 family glycosyl hydrolase
MYNLKRIDENPILAPNPDSIWESEAAFNASVVKGMFKTRMVYRAISTRVPWHGQDLNVSTVGYADSSDGIHFQNRRQLIYPEHDWEEFGCEDPRVTHINGKYYVFYTALSGYPFTAQNIKVAVATSSDLKKIDSKHLVTPFNAKAMAMFPKRINGKLAVVFSVNTDEPPAKVCIAFFDSDSQLWSQEHWNKWRERMDEYTLPLLRSPADQVEVGAAPIRTSHGWLLIYSYIKNYMGGGDREFGIEAVLLDLENPLKVIGRTQDLMLKPEAPYELKGLVPNIVFPTGALVKNGQLYVYYGAADKTVAVARGNLDDLIEHYLLPKKPGSTWVRDFDHPEKVVKLERYSDNPILKPRYELDWESKAVFNPAAIKLDGKVHLVYRALSENNISYFGYASSYDGVTISQRFNDPIYVAGAEFKAKKKNAVMSCEDPRITKIGDMLYMCYTAFDGSLPRVAITSIKASDFAAKRWNWSMPVLISPPDVDDKDACLLPGIINGKYAVFHRMDNKIYLDYVKDLEFKGDKYLSGKIIMDVRKDKWDNLKIGIASPPIDVGTHWLLLYHGVSQPGSVYKVGAVLLDKAKPDKVVARLDYPVFEPKARYELEGQVSNVVFPCGNVIFNDRLYVYYGGCDSVIGAASVNISKLVQEVKKYPL